MSIEELKEFALLHLKTGEVSQGIGVYVYFYELIERDLEQKKGCKPALRHFRSDFFEQATEKRMFTVNVNVLSNLILCNYRLGQFDDGYELDMEIERYLHENASKISDDKAVAEYLSLVDFFEYLEPLLKGVMKQYVLRRQLDYLVWSYTRALNWGKSEAIIIGIIVRGLQVSLRAKRLDKAKLYLIELDKFNKKQGKGEYDNMLEYFKQKIEEMEKSKKPKNKKVELVD